MSEPTTTAALIWLKNLAVLALLLGGCLGFGGLVSLFKHLGWVVPMWIAAGVGIAWCVFTMLMLLLFLLYLADQEVRRGLRR